MAKGPTTPATNAPDGAIKTEFTNTTARTKMNRGSTRRIVRALTEFDKAVDAFIKELDLQFFQVGEDGERVGPAEVVKGLREMRTAVSAEVSQLVAPPTTAEKPVE